MLFFCAISLHVSYLGARYCSSNFSSLRLRRARTRICATTVPVMRGLNVMGGTWQREQLSMNTFSPGEATAAVLCG